jgi:hemerythrin-like metal-binding protein
MVEWDESCSVKVVRFDDDHKQMFSLINKLHAAMLRGKGALAVQETVAQITDHAQGHFSGEEAMMEKTKFPELASHRLEHQELVKRLEQFQRQIDMGNFVSSVRVAEFLDSLMAHTKGTDQKYSEHLNANGIF